jgi:hypothetical protein
MSTKIKNKIDMSALFHVFICEILLPFGCISTLSEASNRFNLRDEFHRRLTSFNDSIYYPQIIGEWHHVNDILHPEYQ